MYTQCHASELGLSSDLNKDGGLDLQEFSLFVKKPSPIEEWAGTLPLAQMVADALPTLDCPNHDAAYISRMNHMLQ